MMEKKVLIGMVLALLFLAMPVATIFTGGSTTGTAPETEQADGIFETSDDVKVEKVNADELSYVLDKISLPKMEGTLAVDPDAMKGALKNSQDRDMLEMAQAKGFRLANPMVAQMNAPPATRGTDADDNDDLANGSKLNNNDNVNDGNLFFPENDPAGTLGDYIDWYKMELTGVDPTVTGKTKNVTIVLDKFTCAETTLYEVTFDSTQYTTDYLDFLEMFIVYVDPFWGFSELGGKKFLYDNGDDTDGWIYDGGNTAQPGWDDNWTANYESVMGSKGVLDTNGMIGGLTEEGWYYIGIMFNYYVTPEATARPDMNIEYGFTVSTKDDINNYPIAPSTTAGGPNDFNNATLLGTGTDITGRDHSGLNYFDWYRFEGQDNNKIWNQSVWVNISWTTFPQGQDFGVTFNDNWMYVMLLWWGEGDDEVYGTEDDIWTIDWKILFFAVSYVDPSGNTVSYMQERMTQSGGNNMFLNIYNINNRTDAVAGHPYLNGKNPRTMFVGLYSTPMKFGQTQTGGLAQLWADYQVFDQYKLDLNIQEVAPNNAPTVDDIKITTEHPDKDMNIFSTTGGFYDTNFRFEVNYTDEDNDPPASIWLVIDPFTPYETPPVNIVTKPTNAFDKDYTDSATFWFEILGKDLGDEPAPHDVLAFAWDTIPDWSLVESARSADFFLNDTLEVWNDEPVMRNENWISAPTIDEDSDPVGIPLEGSSGIFDDPEDEFEGFQVWNYNTSAWDDEYDTPTLTLKIEEFEGYISIVAYPKRNQHIGKETVMVQAFDLHSNATRAFNLKVEEVNDPPMVKFVNIDDVDYPVDNSDPLNPELILDVDVMEDAEFAFDIIAEDTDLEADRTSLRYSYVPSLSGDWENDPDIDFNTGSVTLTGTNDDVAEGNLNMMFNIEDGRDGGQIKLLLTVKVTNTNDPPTISLPPATVPFYNQDTLVTIKVTGTDQDKGDTLTYDVNVEKKVGNTDAVVDQVSSKAKVDDWNMDTVAGLFTFTAIDQNIWLQSDDTMADTVDITFEFSVTDKAGAKVTMIRTLTFKDVNSPPDNPTEIFTNVADQYAKTTDIVEGLTVEMWVLGVQDEDKDEITFFWTFPDGGTATSKAGQHINYTFTSEGQKVIQVYASDGEDNSLEITQKMVTLIKVPVDNGGGGGGGGTVVEEQNNNNTLLIIIIVVVVVLFLIIIAVLMFFVLRKKPAPPAQVYYDQQQLAAFQAQGLPGVTPGALPPGANPELPPAPQDMQQPGAVPPVGAPPMAVTPQVGEIAPQPEAPQGMACPSCGSPVDPTWFLCPNCKAPLQ
jgi:hypothetical protein